MAGDKNGVLEGSLGFGPGEVGQALGFDGVDDYLRVPAAASLDVGAGAGFTLECWINPSDLSHLRPIAEWNSGVVGAQLWAAVETGTTGDADRSLFGNLIDTSGVAHIITSPGSLLRTGVWQHVAISYDKSSGRAAIYYNGGIAAQTNLGTFTPLTSGDLYFGVRPFGPFSGIFWAGGMDEMSLYGRALAASEIEAVYHAGDSGKCPTPPPPPPPPGTNCVAAPAGLVSWWPFEGNAHDVADGNSGDLQGSPSFGRGEVRQALEFDGAVDFVHVPAASSLNVGTRGGFTIEGWINPSDLSQLRPIAEWNSWNIGAHFWSGVDTAAPGDGDRSLFGNLIDTFGEAHIIRTPSSLLRTGVWQHVAITYDKPSGRAAIYYNGGVAAQTNLGTLTPLTSGDLYFGFRPAGPFSGILWAGGMDEMSLYGRALAASEIEAVYHAGDSGKCQRRRRRLLLLLRHRRHPAPTASRPRPVWWVGGRLMAPGTI